ncbi:HTH-type transcriptional regulator DegA [Planctomycetes bacterium Pan216]|uniref:HTH-type transcriptional regulator DegA n=1 Tax=Kolteria novifilia TaxID=2527975 RepID=A0A518AZG3_9BACT|nr:HTH-type transcriptional regulator DegA [Planctomycetes bacterium Pan216]
MAQDKPTRLIDIAERAGVSRVVVGQVLNRSGGANVRISEETRKRVLKIARQMNYRPNRAAQQLRGKRTHLLGLILDTVNLPVFSARLAKIEGEAHQRGYRLVVGQSHHDPESVQEYLHDFVDRGVEGVLCLFDLMRGYREELKPVFKGCPHVVFHAAAVGAGHGCVRVDTAQGMGMIIDHLVERGRKRIGLELWSPSDELMQVRSRAFEESLKRHGMRPLKKRTWTSPSEAQKPDQAMLDDCIDKLVVKGEADAIVCSNDVWAVRLIQRLRRRGLSVPGDVAVTGYDNLEMAEIVEPSLTTIDQCHDDYAKAALDLLEESMAGKMTPNRRIKTISPRLVVREST